MVKRQLACATSTGKFLDFYDLDSFERIARVSGLIPEPHEMVFDSKRRLLYITHSYRAGFYGQNQEPGHEISVVDVDRHEVVEIIDIGPLVGPHDIEYCAATDRIYTGIEATEAGNGIVVIDAATRTVEKVIPLESPNAHWLAIDDDAERAYVSHKDGKSMSIVDLGSGDTIAFIPTPNGAEEVDIDPTGRYVYICTPLLVMGGKDNPGSPSEILKIDTKTFEIVGSCEVGPYISAIRAGDGVLAAMQIASNSPEPDDSGYVWLVDTETMAVTGSIKTGKRAFTARFNPDRPELYVTNIGSGTISVIDLKTQAVTAEIENSPSEIWGGTHGLAIC